MARLFKRGAALSLLRVTDVRQYFPAVNLGWGLVRGPISAKVATNQETTTISDLRVAFEVTKHLGKEPNTTEVRVWNLNQQTRTLLQGKPVVVRLDVGYDGVLEKLFQGDLVWAESRHEGVDWESKILVADGHRAFRHARVNRSYKGGVTVRTALTEAASSMGLTLPSKVLESPVMSTQFVAGLSLQGRAAIEMSRLLAPHGLDWSIQDGRLQILDNRTPRDGEPILITQETGMEGSPEYGAPERKKGKPTLSAKIRLNSKIIPGGKIRVESRAIKGFFRVEHVTHSGDTHGDDWSTMIEAKPL